MLKFWGDISLVLQIVIVVAAVLAFSIFDPLGILNFKKQTLEHTPISVRSVQEIGKLISAEYYGEVLTSLQESIIAEIEESKAEEEDELKDLQDQFREGVIDMWENKGSIRFGPFKKGRKLYDLFYEDNPSLTEHPYYQTYIQKVLEKYKVRDERRLLKDFYNYKSLEELEHMLDSAIITETAFDKARKEQLEIITADRKFRKRQIVVLGRGWVKAGIDFGKFTDRNFKYDRDNRTIHLVGMKPHILISTINPWFIPGKQKGFEVVVITRKAKRPQYMQKVKARSLEKLRQNAIRAGIITQARINAEETLKNFFSLLIPEGVDKVIIHDDFFSYYDKSLLTDKLSATIMESVDSLMTARFKEDSASVVGMRDSLKNKQVFLQGKGYRVQRYSSRLQMVEDEILSSGDLFWLESEQKALNGAISSLKDSSQHLEKISMLPNRLDSIWYFPVAEQVEQYRREVDNNYQRSFKWHQVISRADPYVAYQKEKQQALHKKIYFEIMRRRLKDFYELANILKNNTNQIVKGNETYVRDTMQFDTIVGSQRIINVISLDSAMININGGIRDFLDRGSLLLDPVQLEEVNLKMQNSWEVDTGSVYQLRDSIVNNWKVKFNGGETSINRYSSWFQYLKDSTLQYQYLVVADSIGKLLNSDGKRLANVDVKDFDEHNLGSLHISALDEAWCYPKLSRINSWQDSLKNENYGLSFLRKRTIRKYKALALKILIRKEILKRLKADYMATTQMMLQHSKGVEEEISSTSEYSLQLADLTSLMIKLDSIHLN